MSYIESISACEQQGVKIDGYKGLWYGVEKVTIGHSVYFLCSGDEKEGIYLVVQFIKGKCREVFETYSDSLEQFLIEEKII